MESDKIPDGFFSDFPNLEDLEIYDDWFKLRRFRISSNSFREIKLNAINRWNNLDELHIDSPGLTRFGYLGHSSPKLSFARVFLYPLGCFPNVWLCQFEGTLEKFTSIQNFSIY